MDADGAPLLPASALDAGQMHVGRWRQVFHQPDRSDDRQHSGQNLLTERHIGIVAVAGMMGTGVFLTSGRSLADAGPGGALLSYFLMGLVTISVALTAAEMSALLPATGGFIIHTHEFIDPALGAATGWNWAYAVGIVQAVELVAATLLAEYWTDAIPRAILITVLWLAIIAVNLLPLRTFGETEFAFGMMKISLVVFLVLLGLALDLRSDSKGQRLGFRYWEKDAFKEFAYSAGFVSGWKGRILAVTSTLLNAAFAFAHIQVIGIAGSETENATHAIPRALRRTSIGVFALYLSVIFAIGLILPANHPGLALDGGTALSSPFVIAAKEAGITGIASLVNAVVLTSAFSSGITTLFACSQALLALANDGDAPSILKRTDNRGVPYVSVLAASSLGVTAYLSLQASAATAFWWLVSLGSAAGLVSWCVLCVGHIRLMEGMRVQGYNREDLPYQAPLQPYLAWFALAGSSFVLIFGGSAVFLPGNFRLGDFITAYANIFIFAGLYLACKYVKRTSMVSPARMKLGHLFAAVPRGEQSPAGYTLVADAE